MRASVQQPALSLPLWAGVRAVAAAGPAGPRWPPRAAAYALARAVAAVALDADDADVVRGSDGRPRLVPPRDDSDVSLAHTPGWAIAAAGRGLRCGVDVELASRAVGLARSVARLVLLQRRVLAASEREEDAGLAPAQAAHALLRRWVVKEAWLKAAGLGVTVDMRQIVVSLDEPGAAAGGWREAPALVAAPALAGACRVWRWHDSPTVYAALVAVPREGARDGEAAQEPPDDRPQASA